MTELRELRAQADQRGEDLRIIYELVSISEDRFQRFVRMTLDYLEQSRALIQAEGRNQAEGIKLLFINMHTIKGTARAFHLHAVSEISHEIEQHYNAIRKGESPWDSARLLADLDRVQSVLGQYQEAGRTKLSWDMDDKILRLPRGKMLLGLEKLQGLQRKDWAVDEQKVLDEVETLLMESCYTRLQDVFQDLCAGLDSLAR
ncbi:MAG: Hpt domain-containing protein [Pseudobdellovibrionaceae bacterium]|nr:Hpt domain-containing protein [Pseudobdellovibrionaceae bacterium]